MQRRKLDDCYDDRHSLKSVEEYDQAEAEILASLPVFWCLVADRFLIDGKTTGIDSFDWRCS